MQNIFINGSIYTMDTERPVASAVVTEGNKITYVGESSAAIAMRRSDSHVIDLNGKAVLPGFNDSHMHLVNSGYLRGFNVNLLKVKSIAELLNTTKEFVKSRKLPQNSWIIGQGYNHENFIDEKRLPTKYDLNMLTAQHPICFVHSCNNIAVLNQTAIDLISFKNQSLSVSISDDGIASGKELVNSILSHIPKPSVNEIKYMITEMSSYALKNGVTSIQTDDFETFRDGDYKKIIDAYCQLRKQSETIVRINEQCRLNDISKLLAFMDTPYRTGYGDDFFKIGPVKLITDGGLTNRTASLLSPYTDAPDTCGQMNYTQEEIDAVVNKAFQNNIQVAMHCIGDRASRHAIKSYRKASESSDIKDRRCSLIHCQITDKSIIKDMKELGLIANIQPIFVNYDWTIAESRVGPERLKTSYSWRSMLDEGVSLAFSTDCPDEDLNPLNNIYCAVTRKDLHGNPDGGWIPEQRLSVFDSVRSYTAGSAYAAFEENIKGTITCGKYADFVVLSNDIFKVNPESIKDIAIDMTVLDGNIVYKKL